MATSCTAESCCGLPHNEYHELLISYEGPLHPASDYYTKKRNKKTLCIRLPSSGVDETLSSNKHKRSISFVVVVGNLLSCPPTKRLLLAELHRLKSSICCNDCRCRPQRYKREHDVKVLKNPAISCNAYLHWIPINTSQNDAYN